MNSDAHFQNTFSIVNFNELSIRNCSFYPIEFQIASVSKFGEKFDDIEINKLVVEDTTWYLCLYGMLAILNTGSFKVNSGTVSKLNLNAYNLDSTNLKYLPSAGIFELHQIELYSTTSKLPRVITDLEIKDSYGEQATLLKTKIMSPYNNYQLTEVTLGRLKLSNNLSKSHGAIYFQNTDNIEVIIANSQFESNRGVSGPADIEVGGLKTLKIIGSTFKGFTTTSNNFGQSIHTNSQTAEIYADSVTLMWVEDSQFPSILPQSFSKSAPIYLRPGKLKTKSWTFKNCYTSVKGGAIRTSPDSEFSDDASTFYNNVAYSGGAIFFEKSLVDLKDTNFTNNKAYEGGAFAMEAGSTLTNALGVIFVQNNAVVDGGAVFIKSSQFKIENSTFKKNSAKRASYLHCLDSRLSSNTITNTVFEDNSSTQIGLAVLFWNVNITSSTFKNNFSSSQTNNIFLTYSEANLSGLTFINTKYGSNGEYTDIETAAKNSKVKGAGIQLNIDVKLTLSNTKFENLYAENGGAIYLEGISRITANNIGNN